jgi:hypothetical protein
VVVVASQALLELTNFQQALRGNSPTELGDESNVLADVA